MIKTRTFCDCCGSEFTSANWDDKPVKVTISMTNPAQSGESYSKDHVCRKCRTAIHAFFNSLSDKCHPEVQP